jgi:hypothetical protein
MGRIMSKISRIIIKTTKKMKTNEYEYQRTVTVEAGEEMRTSSGGGI